MKNCKILLCGMTFLVIASYTSAQEIEAYKKGYQDGLAEGYTKGYAAGLVDCRSGTHGEVSPEGLLRTTPIISLNGVSGTRGYKLPNELTHLMSFKNADKKQEVLSVNLKFDPSTNSYKIDQNSMGSVLMNSKNDLDQKPFLLNDIVEVKSLDIDLSKINEVNVVQENHQ